MGSITKSNNKYWFNGYRIYRVVSYYNSSMNKGYYKIITSWFAGVDDPNNTDIYEVCKDDLDYNDIKILDNLANRRKKNIQSKRNSFRSNKSTIGDFINRIFNLKN